MCPPSPLLLYLRHRAHNILWNKKARSIFEARTHIGHNVARTDGQEGCTWVGGHPLSFSLVHHFIHSLVLMYKFLIYFKNLIIKPVVFDFSTSESHKRYQGQCPSITAIKADSISHGPIALTPKVIVSLTQSQQLFLSFLVFFVVNCRFGSVILSRVMLPCTANFCKQRNSQQLFCLF